MLYSAGESKLAHALVNPSVDSYVGGPNPLTSDVIYQLLFLGRYCCCAPVQREGHARAARCLMSAGIAAQSWRDIRPHPHLAGLPGTRHAYLLRGHLPRVVPKPRTLCRLRAPNSNLDNLLSKVAHGQIHNSTKYQ